MTWPGDGQGGNWGSQRGQGGWGPQPGQQPGYPDTGGYQGAPGYGGQQFTGEYQGLGIYAPGPGQDTQPPKNKRTLIVIGIIALIVALGVATTVILIKRNSGNGESQPVAVDTSTPKPTTTSKSSTSTARRSTPKETAQPTNPGWQVISNEDLLLRYEVPASWKLAAKTEKVSAPQVGGVGITHLAGVPYNCGGKSLVRGVVGSTAVKKQGDLNKTAIDFAKGFGTYFYELAGQPLVEMGQPRKVERKSPSGNGTVEGVMVEAKVSTQSDGNCLATRGFVYTLVLDKASAGEYVIVVVNGDSEGGPAQPPSPLPDELMKIVDSAMPYS